MIKIEANIIDLNHLSGVSPEGKFFLVDTNIWMWLLYAKHIPEKQVEKVEKYVSTISWIKENGGCLLYSALSFSELATNVERIEHADFIMKEDSNLTFNQAMNRGASKKKDLRQNNSLRSNIIDVINEVFGQLNNIADMSTTDALQNINPAKFVEQFSKTLLDGTDILISLSAFQDGVANFVTDDVDYCSIENANIYTLNRKALR